MLVLNCYKCSLCDKNCLFSAPKSLSVYLLDRLKFNFKERSWDRGIKSLIYVILDQILEESIKVFSNQY